MSNSVKIHKYTQFIHKAFFYEGYPAVAMGPGPFMHKYIQILIFYACLCVFYEYLGIRMRALCMFTHM